MPIFFPEIVTAHAADAEESRADGDDVEGSPPFATGSTIGVILQLAPCAPFCGIRFRAARNRAFPLPPPVGSGLVALLLIEFSSLVPVSAFLATDHSRKITEL